MKYYIDSFKTKIVHKVDVLLFNCLLFIFKLLGVLYILGRYLLLELFHHWLLVILGHWCLLLNLSDWGFHLLDMSFNLGSLLVGDCGHSFDLSLHVQSVLVWAQDNASTVWNVQPKLVGSPHALLLDGLKPSIMGTINSLVASKSILVRFIQDEMITIP